jgi:FkbM family methyltransferase
MTEAWRFRDGTLDKTIFNIVVLFNEYRLPPRFAPGDIVIDVGAHIGSFAHAVLSRGCENVTCIEADPTNFEIAAENLRPAIESGHVQVVRGAAWRSDRNTDQLRFDGYHLFTESYPGLEGVLNTGNGSVVWGSGEPVTKIAFDEIVDRVTNHGLIDEICGEFHEIGGQFLEVGEDRPGQAPVFSFANVEKFTTDVLVDYLEEAGFTVTWRREIRPNGSPEGRGLFFATRAAAHETTRR